MRLARQHHLAFLLTLSALACSKEEPPPVEPPPEAPAPAPKPPPPPPLPARRFLEVLGEVTLDGKQVATNAEIGETGVIETSKEGHALVTLGPGSLIEVRSGSKLQLGKSERHAMSAR